MTHFSDNLRSYLSSTVRSEEVSRLVQLSRPDRNQRLVYNCTAVISKLHMNGVTCSPSLETHALTPHTCPSV